MNLFVYTGASALSSALVNSATDLTAISRAPDIAYGDSEPLAIQFLSAASTFEPWTVVGGYTVSVAVGPLGGDGAGWPATSNFTFASNTFSGRLSLTGESIAGAIAAAVAKNQPYAELWIQVRVTSPAGQTETYARRKINVACAVGAGDETPVDYATFEDVEAARDAAEASANAAAGSASAAATSATNAATSASGAATSEANASNSASGASTSATTAANSASAASASAAAALTQANSAATARAGAEAAQAAALLSANAAAASAATAGTQATTATTQAGNAATSATSSAASATASASSATASAASATASAGSATAAAGSASSASSSATTALNAIAGQFISTIAGGSVPATASAAGRYYIISSAGTSQSKTWAFGDWAIYNGTSGSWSQLSSGIADAFTVARLRNALAPRGGIFFDGSGTSPRAYSTLPAAITTDDYSIHCVFRAPTSVPPTRSGIVGLGTASVGGSTYLVAAMENSDNLIVQSYDGAAYREFNFPNIVATYGGKVVHLTLVRSGGTMALYVNGAAQSKTDAGTAANWAQNINSAYFIIGSHGGAGSLPAIAGISSASLYNCALNAADVAEVYELGGAVPYRFQWTNSSRKITDAARNSVFTDVATDWTGGALDTANDQYDVTSPTSAVLMATYFTTIESGKAYRVRASISNHSGGNVSVSFTGGTSDTVVSGVGNGSIDTVVTTTKAGNDRIAFSTFTAGAFSLDDVYIERIGAVVHLPLNGGGPQARDESTNDLDADKTSTGVFDLIAAPIGTCLQIRKTYAHSDISSTAATTSPGWLPAGWIVREIQANVTTALDASITLDFGISGTAAKYVSALAVSTTGFKRSVSSSLVPESATSNTTVYIKKSGATTQGAAKVVWLIERIF